MTGLLVESDVAGAVRSRQRIVFLDFLRSAAVLLVIWDHLIGEWLRTSHRGWIPLTQVNRFLTGPFAVIQDFGWLGVSLFFLISGYIITHVAASESAAAFAVRRIMRIYPPLIAAVLLGVAVVALRRWLAITDTALGIVPPLTKPSDAAWSMTLLNWVKWPQPKVLGVTWTLVIEMCFYAMTFLLHPLLKRRAFMTWANLAVVAGVLWTAKMFGTSYFLFAVSVSYVPLLLCGQVLWMARAGRIGVAHAVVLTTAAWIEFVVGLERIQPTFLTVQNSYGVSFFIAYALFLLALLHRGRWHARRPARYVADRSYSLYLLHAPVGLLILDSLVSRVGYTISLLVALIGLFAATELSYRFVERPAQRLARRLTTGPSMLPDRQDKARSPHTARV